MGKERKERKEIYELLKAKGIRMKLGRIHQDDLVKAANIIVAMAWSRDNWIDRVQRILEGSLGEYTKYRCALLRQDKDYWSDEVKKLLENATSMMEKETKTTGFSKEKALIEAKNRIATAQHQIVAATNEYLLMMRDEEKCGAVELKKMREKIKKANFKAKELLEEMLAEFPF